MTARLARLASVAEDFRPNRRIRQNRIGPSIQPATPVQPAQPGRPNRRKESRYSALFDAVLESSHGERAEVMLCEVSLHGCRVKCEANWLRTGAFVAIALDNEPALQAIVRWIRDGSAGMEFLRQIPPDRGEWHELLDMPF